MVSDGQLWITLELEEEHHQPEHDQALAQEAEKSEQHLEMVEIVVVLLILLTNSHLAARMLEHDQTITMLEQYRIITMSELYQMADTTMLEPFQETHCKIY